jgi:hypothetical protein
VVVKLTGTVEETQAEAAALAAWAHTGAAVRLIDADFTLWNGAAYVLIDPMAHIGDPCADVGFFAAGHRPAATILRRATAIAELMGLPQHRAQRWAAVWAVLQTCQAWRDDQAELEACLSSRDFEQLIRR